MFILNQQKIKKILPLSKIDKVIKAVEKAFFDLSQEKIQMPPKIYLYFKKYNGDLRIMPSFSETLNLAGVKLVNVHPENFKKRLPTVMAVILLYDPRTGLPLVLMDGIQITALRTGAVSAIATKKLAREDANTLGVVGAGFQAITQIAAISKVKKLKEILVYDINKERIKNLAKILKKEKIEIKEGTLEEVCQKDILVTVTPAREPIVKMTWIKPGTHINAIGADAAGKEELEPEILKRAKIIVDNKEQAFHSGEINVPLEKGIIKKEDIFASLDEIVSNKKIGRENKDEITIFDSTGLAIQDLYTASLVFKEIKGKEKSFDIF
ncbi:MAG: ornithine cyclodeaminase family protein [Minisyncoccia bacterium]